VRKVISRFGTRRLDPLAGVRRNLLLLDRDLEHASQHAVVPMNRRRRDACGDLVVEPVLDLVGRKPAEAVRAEPRQQVPFQVARVGLLCRRRQSPGERQELLGPRMKRDVRAGRVNPAAALDVDLLLA
jgi:hypothetical protein